jgi:hypothetical protein
LKHIFAELHCQLILKLLFCEEKCECFFYLDFFERSEDNESGFFYFLALKNVTDILEINKN